MLPARGQIYGDGVDGARTGIWFDEDAKMVVVEASI
jgi:hypothetical protein